MPLWRFIKRINLHNDYIDICYRFLFLPVRANLVRQQLQPNSNDIKCCDAFIFVPFWLDINWYHLLTKHYRSSNAKL
jgi:hypothetical protein